MSTARPVVTKMTADEKMDIIRSGKRKRSLTGLKENKNITFENKGGKYVAVETEKKFEEAGVTKKKKNFIMFESKLGTEKDVDITKIAGAKAQPKIQPRTDERIVQKAKKIEYLDNYQYKETKDFGKKPRPAVVIHKRFGDIFGGSSEEYSYQKITTTTGGNVPSQLQSTTKTTTTKTTTTKTMKENKSDSNLRARVEKPAGKAAGESSATATKTVTSTTKVGRRGGAGGATSTTTESTTKTTTTRTTKRGVK
jgi:hypothetical protein